MNKCHWLKEKIKNVVSKKGTSPRKLYMGQMKERILRQFLYKSYPSFEPSMR